MGFKMIDKMGPWLPKLRGLHRRVDKCSVEENLGCQREIMKFTMNIGIMEMLGALRYAALLFGMPK